MPSPVASALLVSAVALAVAGLSVTGVGVICALAVIFESYLFYLAGQV